MKSGAGIVIFNSVNDIGEDFEQYFCVR